MATEIQTFGVLNRILEKPKEEYDSSFLEIQAQHAVHNRVLTVALIAACTVIVAGAASVWRIANAIRAIEPTVIRIDPSGEPVVAPYASLAYKPRVNEMKYFLSHFVHDHYSMMRASIVDSFTREKYYLDSALSSQIDENQRRTKAISTFLTSAEDEVDIEVRQIVIDDLKTSPYKAVVEFDKVFRAPQDRVLLNSREKKRERFTATIHFRFMETVPTEMIQHNPLGFTVTEIHEDKAFIQ